MTATADNAQNPEPVNDLLRDMPWDASTRATAAYAIARALDTGLRDPAAIADHALAYARWRAAEDVQRGVTGAHAAVAQGMSDHRAATLATATRLAARRTTLS